MTDEERKQLADALTESLREAAEQESLFEVEEAGEVVPPYEYPD